MLNIITSVASTLVILLISFNTMTMDSVKYLTPEYWSNNRLGSFTEITSSDKMSAFPVVYNANLAKTVEVGTTSIASITTLSNLSSIGTITTGVWSGTAIPVDKGGTGTTSPTSNMVILGNGASGFKVVNGFGTSGQFLSSNGAGNAPTWETYAFDQTGNYTFTGTNLFTASTTFTATTTILANSLNRALVINGLSYIFPSSRTAGSVLTENGSGTLSWSSAGTLLLATTTASSVTDTGTTEQTAFTYSLPGNLLSTNNAIRVRFRITAMNLDHTTSGTPQDTVWRFKYDDTTMITLTFTSINAAANPMNGDVEFILFANGATNSQIATAKVSVGMNAGTPSVDFYQARLQDSGTATEDSTSAKNITITGQVSADDADNNGFTIQYGTVELLKL